MKQYFPHLFCAITTVIIWLLNFLFVLLLHRQWWRIRGVRRALWIAPLISLFFVALWALGTGLDVGFMKWVGAITVAALLPVSIAILISMPFTGVAQTLERIVLWKIRRAKKTSEVNTGEEVRLDRRSFITTTSAAIPATAVLAAGGGIVNAYSNVGIPEIPLHFVNLPPALKGFRIWHLSDLHIGYFKHLDELERILLDAQKMNPDIALVTGDIADDVKRYPDALKLISQLKTRYGVFATLGNHEYFYDFNAVLKSFERGTVPLLRSTGASVQVGDTVLYIAGADDPVTMKFDETLYQRLRTTVDASLNDAPNTSFKILMSHRPEGFDRAAENGIQLTLSGHTHGRQIGFNGRSIFALIEPERYLWGLYTKGESQLYTTAGSGHWFPFRLGCPPEAPIYVLL